MFLAIKEGSPTGGPTDVATEEDDSTPSFHLDLDEANHAGPKAPRAGALKVIISNSDAQPGPPTSTMNIRVVKVLREKSDAYSVSFKVRMSDGFVENVRSCSPSYSSALHLTHTSVSQSRVNI